MRKPGEVMLAIGAIGAWGMLGAILGVLAGFGVAMAIGYLFVLMFPNDPSAGSVGIVVILTVPAGAFLGFVTGAVLAALWSSGLFRRRTPSNGESGARFEMPRDTRSQP